MLLTLTYTCRKVDSTVSLILKINTRSPWVRKIPWRGKWQPILVFLPRKFHGQRSLVGYSPWGRKELDTTKRLHFLGIFHSMDAPWASQVAEWYRIRLPMQEMQETQVRSPGVGNGNPLQYSCLGSSMDRGAWWATIHGIAESQV